MPNEDNKAKKDKSLQKEAEKRAAKREEERARRRMIFWYRLLRGPARLYVTKKLNFSAQPVPAQKNNYLLLYNHNTDFDFVLCGTQFREPMYFVASEHILQGGVFSRLLSYLFAPIGRVKGTTAASTVMSILHTLKRGDNVCLAAEGDRSWNGLTRPILFSTGKLAKSSGSALITYRIKGGYLTTPRWSYSVRKGRMEGEVVHIYSPEELAGMSNAEINAAINRDLFEDAYARQDEEHTVFSGNALAEGLEHALYICPECGSVSRMSGSGDVFSCECGMSVTYDKYGYLDGGRFRTVTQWDEWQTGRLRELIDKAKSENSGEPVFSDPDCVLYSIDADHNRSEVCRGTLSISVDSLDLGEYSFRLGDMTGLAVYGRKTMVFVYDGVHYEISSPLRLCCTKYEEARRYITGGR